MPDVISDRLNAALYQFFHRLRQDLHTQLGVGEYKLVYEAQEKGVMLGDEAAVWRFCKSIWLKDQTQLVLFKELFDAIVGPTFREKAPQKQEADLLKPDSGGAKPKAPEPTPLPPTPSSSDLDDLGEDEVIERMPDSDAAPGEGELSVAVDQSAGFSLDIPEEKLSREAGISTHRFLLNERYLPVSPRDMQQHWRFLQNTFDQGIIPEIDLTRTVDAIARRGMLLEPVYHKRTINRTHLLFLIDDSPSMVAFENLSKRLVEAALEDPFVTDEEVFYFSNFPGNQLYNNPYHTESELLPSIWRRCHRHTMMLIISDGGASRGQTDFNRIRSTNAFLKEAMKFSRRIAWLNPMPRERWKDTSAEYIARRAPMFEVERMGLYKAIQILKGKVLN